MKYPLFLLSLLLVSCTPSSQGTDPSPDAKYRVPQAEEQCEAQPELPWCK